MRTGIGLAGLAASLLATAAAAQLLPDLGGLPGGLVGGVLPGNTPATRVLGVAAPTLEGLRSVPEAAPTLLDLRRARLRAIVRDNRALLDSDPNGNPIRRGAVIALAPSAALIEGARTAGFAVLEREDMLGIGVVLLKAPARYSPAEALKALRKIDPAASLDFDHLFEPAGGGLAPLTGAAAAEGSGAGAPIGMIDGGVAQHPALAGAAIEQRGFVPGAPRPSGHGTAVASLLVGHAGAFVGAAKGRRLLVADIYGGQAASGSALGLARGLGWLADRGVRVVTISLVGPPNLLLERAVRAVQARGITLVAAVGNDGPAAPAQYPAAYPQVIAVTAVDARGRALPEAGRAAHLDFAAPGADMAAALPGSGYAAVRGTSFAAPLVAARVAAANGRLAALDAEARPGKGKVGRGILCGACRIDPKAVAAKK